MIHEKLIPLRKQLIDNIVNLTNKQKQITIMFFLYNMQIQESQMK